MEKNVQHTAELQTGICEPMFVGQPVNPLDADAMQFLYNLGKQSKEYIVQEIDGATYVNTKDLTRIKPHEQPAPESFGAKTLSGLVEWLRADVDGMFDVFGTLYVSVCGVNHVRVLSPVFGQDNTRKVLAFCEVDTLDIRLNSYLDPEDFVIMMQTDFCEGENRDAVLKIAGNLRMEQDATTADDGMSQRVTVKQGIAAVGETTVRNPVMLAPHRTFHEVEQPSSPFVLRFKKEDGCPPGVALFEADGGAWKIDAIVTVGEWLKRQLEGLNVVVIA